MTPHFTITKKIQVENKSLLIKYLDIKFTYYKHFYLWWFILATTKMCTTFNENKLWNIVV